jgi:hypothetical protein
MEFCEVASMSMELFGSDHLDVFYDETDANRARRVHLEGIIRFFPWMATIDSFQHWIYTHPGHSRDQRTEQEIVVGVLAVPADAAQAVADRLVEAGVKIIFNYSEALLQVPPEVTVHTSSPAVDLLYALYFHLT